MSNSVDTARWRCHTKVEKYAECRTELGISADEWDGFVLAHDIEPYDVIDIVGNLLITLGINRVWSLATGQGGTTFSNANANLGVGNSATAATAADTDLNGASKLRKGMKAGYPTVPASGATQFQSDFLTGEANFAWQEWGVFDANAAGQMLNHKVESLGTKASGTWTLTVTLSIT